MCKLLVIAGGSPSSIIATAMFLRECSHLESPIEAIRSGQIKVVFTQAFQVGEHPKFGVSAALQAVRDLPEDGEVVWIGLGVNNQDPKMTENIFREIGDGRIFGVYDEHEPERWEALVETLDLSAPVFATGKTDTIHSAASLIAGELRRWGMFDQYTTLLRDAGDWADNRQMDVSDEAKALATDVSNATKVRMGDDAFRVTSLLHLLGDEKASVEFAVRLEEAKAINEAVEKALLEAVLDGLVLVIHKAPGKDGLVFDDTDAMIQGYRRAAFVAVVGEKSGEGPCIQVGVNGRHPRLGKTNLLQVLPGSTGIPAKATVRGTQNLPAILATLNALT
ncbi:TPA: hypothetical protein DCW61_05010 [Candidatus Uhrbacteria bacterium]|nr:hypothetical protein [Candidatus Uhrbacteria bacterium]